MKRRAVKKGGERGRKKEIERRKGGREGEEGKKNSIGKERRERGFKIYVFSFALST